MSILSRYKNRINEPPEEFESRALHEWSSGLDGVTSICALEPRSHVKTAGVVQSIRLTPGATAPTLEVTIFDGTGEVMGVWLGRKRIPGIDLGSQIVFTGTTCECRGVTGRQRLQIVNPSYDLQPQTIE